MKSIIASTLVAAAVAAPYNSTIVARANDVPYMIKKGLAYNNGNVLNALSRPNSATWAYNWGAAQNAPRFQQIPMCWGPNGSCDKNGINAKISAGDTPWVLGYNEPDETYANGGCQKTPREAYDAWGNDMFPFQQRGAKLVCPAVSSWNTDRGHAGYAAGLQWLRQFALTKNNPGEFRCEAQALHWYGLEGKSGTEQGQLFIDYIAYAHGVVNDIFRREMPLWITEFAPLPLHNTQIMADFLRKVIPWLDAQPWVYRYSPFMAEDLISGSSPNEAGWVFVNGR